MTRHDHPGRISPGGTRAASARRPWWPWPPIL
jgi:hypothetical protein